ncbi:MAG: DedA family protein [Nitrospirales bacterium]|nr:DedA family protein [Nitrospira sp.]MDR4500158.1 DedA family protein [Nitrospirales bacterium]
MSAADYSLGGLFLSAFISSTLFPGGSEVVLAVLVAQQNHNPWVLCGVATAGNTLGGMSSWAIGWLLSWRYPVSGLVKVRHRQAVERVQRWGNPLLLLSWVPVIGDPLCVAAGWLRIRGIVALMFIGFGKALRYAVIVALLS